jgi:hemerythrin superfamily protein
LFFQLQEYNGARSTAEKQSKLTEMKTIIRAHNNKIERIIFPFIEKLEGEDTKKNEDESKQKQLKKYKL